MMPRYLQIAVDAKVPAGITHIGFVPIDVDGQLLVAEPQGHPSGVSATFSKIRIDGDESASDALARCIRQQVGVPAESLYPIDTVWSTDGSSSYMFAGLLESALQNFEPHRGIRQEVMVSTLIAGQNSVSLCENPAGTSRSRTPLQCIV